MAKLTPVYAVVTSDSILGIFSTWNTAVDVSDRYQPSEVIVVRPDIKSGAIRLLYEAFSC